MIHRHILYAALAAFAFIFGATGPSAAGPMLRIAYTSELRGNLLPCLCPTAPLGGLARRVGYIDSLRQASDFPLLALDGGSALPRAEDLEFVPPEDRQGLVGLHAEAARAIGYDAMLAAAEDAEVTGLPWLHPNEARRIEIESIPIIVVGVDERIDPEPAAGAIARLGTADLTILLCAGDYYFASRASALLDADVAVVGRGARYATPIWSEGTLLLGCGTDGKHVGNALVEITDAGTIEVHELQLRRMDGTVPRSTTWQDRVEELVLRIESKRPGALTAAE